MIIPTTTIENGMKMLEISGYDRIRHESITVVLLLL